MVDYRASRESSPKRASAIRDDRQIALDEWNRSTWAVSSLEFDHCFPESFVDDLTRREVFNKHLFRPNTYLHKWWARRCGSMFRAILKHFAPESERRCYYAPGGLEGKVILDPMMGGGTTLHEAIRLGANVIGADIDPIPVAQARASLTDAELPDLRDAFDRFYSRLYDSVGHYFRTECPTCGEAADVQYTLHGVRKSCTCREVVQIDQYEIRQESGRTISVCPDSWQIREGVGGPEPGVATADLVTKADKTCPSCGHEYADLLDVPFYARYVPVAAVAVCERHGLFFRSPSESDHAHIREANARRAVLKLGPPDHFAIVDGPKSGDLLRRGVRSYLDLFSSRQLLYLDESIRLLQDYRDAEKLNLAMLVSTSLEFNSMMCGYKGWYKRRPGAIRHVFALHAYSFPYTALENNPVNPRKTSGNLRLLFRDRIERGRKWAALPVERKVTADGKSETVTIPGEVDGGEEVFNQADLVCGFRRFWLIHGDSSEMPIDDGSVDLVVTDPPYYDSVQYSDLAAFFRVWLARMLPDELEWAYDETRSAVETGNGGGSFTDALSGIFAECARVLKTDVGRMVFTFHHWDPEAWAELTIALRAAGFRLTNAYAVHSEHPISVHIRNLNSIRHDSILVFALGGVPPTEWTPPERIETNDSETFCRQCGIVLGWLLESEHSESEIREAWRGLMQGKADDGESR